MSKITKLEMDSLVKIKTSIDRADQIRHSQQDILADFICDTMSDKPDELAIEMDKVRDLVKGMVEYYEMVGGDIDIVIAHFNQQ